MTTEVNTDRWTVTRNACKLCTPLGACLAFKGVRGAVPFMHGSQGCSTYIRRYMISHFKEPIDIASSNFSENTAVFGGGKNLHNGLDNVTLQYHPELIGIMTTCLSETIGDDVGALIREYRSSRAGKSFPELVHVSTPSYSGTHAEGFTWAVRALVEQLHETGKREMHLNLFPGMLSPADLRYLKEILQDFGISHTLLPDYSETLDGGLWHQYHPIPSGGTTLAEIRATGTARGSIEFGAATALADETAGASLTKLAGIPNRRLPTPIGIAATDRFMEAVSEITGVPIPQKYTRDRSRLADAYADGHKYVFEAKAIVLGEEDLAAGLAGFLVEIGMEPVVVASGGRTGNLRKALQTVIPDLDRRDITVADDSDFMAIEDLARDTGADLVIGNSKAYKLSCHLGVPLIRVGFPIHDRFGATRLQHVGYQGTQQLFDRVVNAIMERRQGSNEIGYTYI